MTFGGTLPFARYRVLMMLESNRAPPADSVADNNIQSGMLLMLAGTMIVPGMDAIAKYLGNSVSALQITWGRFFFQSLLFGLILLFVDKRHRQLPANTGAHALRGLLLAIATMLFFWSLNYLPLADAIAIFFIQPMILSLLAALFLGEQIGWPRRIAILCGFAGAMLIIRPGSASFSLYAFLPMLTALFFSCYLVLTRAYARGESPIAMQLYSGISAMVILTVALMIVEFRLPGLPMHWVNPSRTQWALLFGIGLIAAIGHLLIVMGMSRAPASVLAPLGYSEIVAATLLGWLVFGDWPDLWTISGIIIIVASGLYVFRREQRLSRHRVSAPAIRRR